VSIHEHPSKKLGRQPHDPNAHVLKLADFLTGKLPDVPKTSAYGRGVPFGLYTNDKFGICGPTSCANHRRMVTQYLTGKMVAPSQAAVNKLYRDSGNPHFDPSLAPDDPRQDDKGVNMVTMLKALVAGGEFDGVPCLGWAAVNVSNREEWEAASTLFGGQLLGVTLQKAQKTQKVWDYVPGSGEWGGHAVMMPDVNPDEVATWGELVGVTPAFVQHQLDEAYVVLWPEMLTDYGFVRGMDVGRWAKAFEDYSGKKFPVPVPDPMSPLDWDVIGKRD
jgi:hypothetical protein